MDDNAIAHRDVRRPCDGTDTAGEFAQLDWFNVMQRGTECLLELRYIWQNFGIDWHRLFWQFHGLQNRT
ncbi:hypothetical protein BBJ41_36930 [Burkholderia stabilis]|nr:hypothetical protein BBJ41_36930 [Burkholderia stabilis]